MNNVLHRDLTQEHLHIPKLHAHSHAEGGSDAIVFPSGSVGPKGDKGDPGSVGFGLVPVGGTIGWLKSLTGTPAIGQEYVECNGQIITDSETTYLGVRVPDLNGASSSKKFLRGSITSGTTVENNIESHYHLLTNGTQYYAGVNYYGPDAQQIYFDSNTGFMNALCGPSNYQYLSFCASWSSYCSVSDAYPDIGELNPSHYEVVYVMRIK